MPLKQANSTTNHGVLIVHAGGGVMGNEMLESAEICDFRRRVLSPSRISGIRIFVQGARKGKSPLPGIAENFGWVGDELGAPAPPPNPAPTRPCFLVSLTRQPVSDASFFASQFVNPSSF